MNPNVRAWYKMALPEKKDEEPKKEEQKQSYKLKPNCINGQKLCTTCGCNGKNNKCTHGEPSHYRDCCTYYRFGFMCDHLEDK
ncbi:MAG: hypothetical protein DRI61_12725 [Chloroflexi bacterium]|nr:MAG: hypothetical protein DRI61_12725 [Chloroflexota bacterium]